MLASGQQQLNIQGPQAKMPCSCLETANRRKRWYRRRREYSSRCEL